MQVPYEAALCFHVMHVDAYMFDILHIIHVQNVVHLATLEFSIRFGSIRSIAFAVERTHVGVPPRATLRLLRLLRGLRLRAEVVERRSAPKGGRHSMTFVDPQ